MSFSNYLVISLPTQPQSDAVPVTSPPCLHLLNQSEETYTHKEASPLSGNISPVRYGMEDPSSIFNDILLQFRSENN
ncbi:hypothetical protein TNIN_121101 [Trichonephila inaurata madagascariensis]|uniref:Uncharacterized protein n=1 Tax=Trichonephila inaurata madagascariensis TaxID=2747483 RepID=A0A8X6WXB1_9ARAC|nr:hypothetical protein TNIN_121101 [Trichonephila inaurata madagascariensis]